MHAASAAKERGRDSIFLLWKRELEDVVGCFKGRSQVADINHRPHFVSQKPPSQYHRGRGTRGARGRWVLQGFCSRAPWWPEGARGSVGHAHWHHPHVALGAPKFIATALSQENECDCPVKAPRGRMISAGPGHGVKLRILSGVCALGFGGGGRGSRERDRNSRRRRTQGQLTRCLTGSPDSKAASLASRTPCDLTGFQSLYLVAISAYYCK